LCPSPSYGQDSQKKRGSALAYHLNDDSSWIAEAV
jgi:hypothetical protein